jgi:hypothetical protein
MHGKQRQPAPALNALHVIRKHIQVDALVPPRKIYINDVGVRENLLEQLAIHLGFQLKHSPPMPALPASAHFGADRKKKPIEVIMAPRSGAGLQSAMEAAGIEPASADAPVRTSTSVVRALASTAGRRRTPYRRPSHPLVSRFGRLALPPRRARKLAPLPESRAQLGATSLPN